MLEIEIINASLLPFKGSNGIDTFCVLKIFGKEVARTSPVINTFEPIWNEKFEKQYEELAALEKTHNRPFFFETFDLEVHELTKNSINKIYEARIPFINVNTFKGYKLLRANASEQTLTEYGRIFVRITRLFNTDNVYKGFPAFSFAQLAEICPKSSPYYRHLYMDFDWSPLQFTYRTGLPGPISGEQVMDMYHRVEWRTPSSQNSFGDKLSGSIHGSLIITDLRVIFLPIVVVLPFKTINLVLTDHMSSIYGELLLYYHKYTLQFLLSALQDVRAQSSSHGHRTTLQCKLTNEQHYEFILHRPHANAAADTIVTGGVGRSSGGPKTALPNPSDSLPRRPSPAPFDLTHGLYYRGLAPCPDPYVWASRVADYLTYEIRLDNVWLRWAKAMKRSALSLFSSATDRVWLKKIKAPFNLDIEYKRMYVQDLNWRLSDLNASYHLCPTYPSVLVFPGQLEDDDLIAAAPQRSIGRLPALVWLHPETKAPLCRASQPMAGLSGTGIEYDKKICLAVRASCPTSLPFRIADARPKLNANANAMQGKGFENVSFMGGSSVVSLVFLDIDNIHVMRHSLNKLKESFGAKSAETSTTSSSSMSVAVGMSGSTSTGIDTTSNTVHSSKWTHHVAGLLRGACSVADSLMLGHSVLVHCSDGWDRTAQLTTLAQVLLDPYYRTIDGLLVLINKEWCAFGHKFEERLNRIAHLPKEASPVFLQVLDCIYQLIVQFPNSFQYTEDLLLIIVFHAQSHAVATFRGNNERERILMLRAGLLFEDMTLDDAEFSSLGVYIQMLLRTSNYSRHLVNVCYTPPSPQEARLQYLRPRCSNHDVVYWKEGLFGLNFNLPELSALSSPRVSQQESAAVMQDLLARFMSFLDVHSHAKLDPSSALPSSGEVSASSISDETYKLQEILKASPYPCPPFAHAHAHGTQHPVDTYRYRSLTSSLYRSSSAAYLYPRRLIFSSEKDMARLFLVQRLCALLPEVEDMLFAKGLSASSLSGGERGEKAKSMQSQRTPSTGERQPRGGSDMTATTSRPPTVPEGDSDDEEGDEDTREKGKREEIVGPSRLSSEDSQDSLDDLRHDVSLLSASFFQVKEQDALQYVAYLETQRRALQVHAAITLQSWFRAILATRLAVLVHGITTVDYFQVQPYGSNLPRKTRKLVQAYWRVFFILASSHLKGRQCLRDALYHVRAQFVRGIVDEVVAMAVTISQRERLAFDLATNMLNSMEGAAMTISSGGAFAPSNGLGAGGMAGGNGMSGGGMSSGMAETSPKPSKTLSSRLLRPFMGSSGEAARSVSPVPSRLSRGAGNSESTATTGEEEEVREATKASGHSNKSFTRRMMGGFF